MGAPDFFFAVNAMFRHLHDRFGKAALIRYWRELGRDYYRARWERWRSGGTAEIARDWREYFSHEPGAGVTVTSDAASVTLDIPICPAIKHLRESGHQIAPYFCEHCDHVCGTMAEAAGFAFERTGGMGTCQQRFVRIGVAGRVA